MTDVLVAGGSEETRLLLRGLLRLHHHRVIGDLASGSATLTIPADAKALVAVVDANLQDPEWERAIADARRQHPDLKIVLLTATRSTEVLAKARTLGVAAIVRRPFAVRELIEAVGPATPPASPAPPNSTPSGPA
jgi:DNA-binding NarL/FixJ family response regulator